MTLMYNEDTLWEKLDRIIYLLEMIAGKRSKDD